MLCFMFGHSQKVIIGRCHKCTRTEVDTASYGPEDEVRSGIGRGRILHELSVLYIAKNFGHLIMPQYRVCSLFHRSHLH